jgi:hypothetical protein
MSAVCPVAASERCLELDGVAGHVADERLVQALEHGAGADLVGDAGHRVDLLAVDDGLEVDRGEVTLGRRALHADERAEAGPQRVQAHLDVLVGDLQRVDLDLDAGEVGQLELGHDVDLGVELEVLAVLDGELGEVQLGLAQRAQVVLLHRAGVVLRQGLVERLLHHGPAAEPLVDDARRHLPAAEAGDVHRGTDGLVCRVQPGCELLGGDLHAQLHPGRADFLNGTLHDRALQGLSGMGSIGGSGTAQWLGHPAIRFMVSVGVAGFEPAAFRSQSGRATKLRHTPSCARRRRRIRPHRGRAVQ